MGYPDHHFNFRLLLFTSLVLLLAICLPTVASASRVPADLPQGAWDHLIITDQSLKPSFMPLARHRRGQGLRCRVLSTDHVQRWSGQDDLMEAVRWFVDAASRQWGTRYVLLGGDAEFIPVPLGRYESLHFSWDIPLDLYYAAPDGEWDLDGDGILGEDGDDAPDLTPVVALGRAPVSDRTEARSFVDKVIAFETGATDHGVLLAAEVGIPYPWQPGMEVQFDFAWLADEVAEILADQESIGDFQRLYQNWEAAGNAEPLGRAEFLEALRSGRHRFSSLFIHGTEDTWSLGPDNLVPDQVEDLDHALFMVAGVAQATDCRGEGVLEKLLTLPGGGCVGAVGPSAMYYLTPAQRFYRSFWQGLADIRVGDAYRRALVEQIQGYPVNLATLQCMSIVGDPALLFMPAAEESPRPERKPGLELSAGASPNPFNPSTQISFVLPGDPGTSLTTVVEIFDLAGRRLTRLLDDDLAPGVHSVRWQGKDAAGRSVGAGLFFARIQAGGAQTVVKLILVE